MTHFPVRRWPAVLAALALIALIPRTSAAAEGAAEAPRVEAEEVKRLAAKGEVVIIDTREQGRLRLRARRGRAAASRRTELESRLAELPKDKLIAAYCT